MNTNNILTYTQRGQYHPNQNQDFVVSYQRGVFDFMAVMDGCSSGRDAHFASSFIGKSLLANFKRIVNEYIGDGYYLLEDDGLTVQDLLSEIIVATASDIKELMTLIDIGEYDMLSTLIAFLWDEKAQQGYIMAWRLCPLCYCKSVSNSDRRICASSRARSSPTRSKYGCYSS